MRAIVELVKDSIIDWGQKGGVLYAAVLSFYAIFSMTPLAMLVVGVAGLVFSQSDAFETLIATIAQFMGPDVATVIQNSLTNTAVARAGYNATGLIAAVVALGVLLFGASLVFYGIQVSLNAMWGIVPRKVTTRQNLFAILQTRLLTAAAVLGVGLIFLATMLINALWSAVSNNFWQNLFLYSQVVVPLANLILSPVLYTVIFTLIFKLLPQARSRWRDVWVGAAVTAVLFWLGGIIVWISLGIGVISSVYGAASSLISFIIWIYYSAMIFLFGANFTQHYAERYGTPIAPNEFATSSLGK